MSPSYKLWLRMPFTSFQTQSPSSSTPSLTTLRSPVFEQSSQVDGMLSDEQWNNILDSMARQESLNAVHHAHASDQPFPDFNTVSFNHTASHSLGAEYTEPSFTGFAAPQNSVCQDIDNHSVADLRKVSKELQVVKQRLEIRSKQVDKLLTNMQNVFTHLAEIDPFLRETRALLKDVAARVDGGWEAISPNQENNASHGPGDTSEPEEHAAFLETGERSSGWMGASG